MVQKSHSKYGTLLLVKMYNTDLIRRHLDTITEFLKPLLPLTNCHMVEFLTEGHWEKYVPSPLRKLLNELELCEAVERFWNTSQNFNNTEIDELSKWIAEAHSHCLTANNIYCLTVDQLKQKIKNLGGDITPEVEIKDFMSPKKSYEVQTMSHLVASFHQTLGTTGCIEAGGGRGHLLVALSLGYHIPSLTIDCDSVMLLNAEKRVKIIQKQWHAISRKSSCTEKQKAPINKELHQFAHAFITKHTDLTSVFQEKFPEYSKENVKLLLTGLHTCGNLGADSLRIFETQDSVKAIFNVTCCYHLLTEVVDDCDYDVFEKRFLGEPEEKEGFPMSDYLKGYNLGRNARMLAAQSIDRVVKTKQLPSKSLLYRAMLQVIIKQNSLESHLSEGKLKRVSSKIENFRQYFQAADAILGLQLFDRLPDSYLTAVMEDIDDKWKKLCLFYLLRLCLAQVVESVILLDRVLYLRERSFDEVFLVKLFDPVLSPRCHAVVAIK